MTGRIGPTCALISVVLVEWVGWKLASSCDSSAVNEIRDRCLKDAAVKTMFLMTAATLSCFYLGDRIWNIMGKSR